MGCGSSTAGAVPESGAGETQVTSSTQGIPMPAKEPTQAVSEATALPSAPVEEPAAAAAVVEVQAVGRSPASLVPGQKQKAAAVIETVQAFRPPTPDDEPLKLPQPAATRSLPPLAPLPAKSQPSASGSKAPQVEPTEVDRILAMNSSMSKSDALVLMDDVAPMTPPQRQQAGQPNAERSGASGVTSTIPQPFEQPQDDMSEPQESQAEASAPEQAPEPEDPWASLQAAYRPGAKASMTAAQRRKAAGATGDDDDDDEVELLDQGRPSSSGLKGTGSGLAAGPARSSGQVRAPPARISGAPAAAAAKGKAVAGGWGDGELAAAGTLMLDDSVAAAGSPAAGRGRGPPGAVERRGAVEDDDDDGPAIEAGGAVGGPGDLGVEDFEDVDALIEAEMAGMNKGLADKLAKFEALMDDDDDYTQWSGK